MTKFKRFTSILITLATTASVLNSSTFAAVIYDNSSSYQGTYFSSPNEFGDQINFVGPERIITSFKFDYYLGPNASGNETVDLRMYNNAPGSGGAPSVLLYDSGPISISKGFNTITADGLGITAQDTLTWTVLFGGIDPFEVVGLLVYDPPVLGKSFNDYWEKDPSSGFVLKQFTGDPLNTVANFGAVVSAVPEPGTLQLAFVGGLVWLGFAAKRRFLSSK